MKQVKAAIYSLIISILFTFNVQAENSLAFELALPPAIAFETGAVFDNNSYLAGKFLFTTGKVYGGEVTWVKASSDAGNHWWGGGIGHTQDDEDNFISFDLDAYVTLNYKYYSSGINKQGFHFNAAIRAYKDIVLPAFGFGYNF